MINKHYIVMQLIYNKVELILGLLRNVRFKSSGTTDFTEKNRNMIL